MVAGPPGQGEYSRIGSVCPMRILGCSRPVTRELDETPEPSDHRGERFNFFGPGAFVRNLVSTLLIGLILACPLLCQAAQMDPCADDDRTTSGPLESPQGPLPCPDDGISCICAGAVHSTDLRASDLVVPELLPSLDSWLLAAFLPPTTLPLQHVARDGVPPDRAPWGHPRRLHALTQHFRC